MPLGSVLMLSSDVENAAVIGDPGIQMFTVESGRYD